MEYEGNRSAHVRAGELASARTMAAVPPLKVGVREFHAKDVGRLGVAAVAATVVLVTAIALARGGYEVPTRTRTADSEVEAPRAASLPESPGVLPSSLSARPGLAPTSPTTGPAPGVKTETGAMREARATFEDAVRKRNTKGALEALEALVALDTDVLADPSVRANVVALSQPVSLLPGKEPERFLNLLAAKSGTRGIDLLYELVATKGGSRAARDSQLYLEDPHVIERGSPALQIAWALRKAESCQAKKPLLARASTDGDRRALGLLQMAKQSCRRGAKCCDWKDAELDATLAAIQARLGAP
jgi:eukaryotic-like serine/threonine-protein kinase